MARLPAVGLGAGLPYALGPFRLRLAVTCGWLTAGAAVLGHPGLYRLQRCTWLGPWPGKLFHLASDIMEHVPHRRLALFQGNLDGFICRHAKVHETQLKPTCPCFATIWEAE